MKKIRLALIANVFILVMSVMPVVLVAGCGNENNTNNSESVYSDIQTEEHLFYTEDITDDEMTNEAVSEILYSSRIIKDKLMFRIQNVYSGNDYYETDISGSKSDKDIGIQIEEEFYSDFKIELYKNGELADTLNIKVPSGDRFLIMESVKKDLSYGCEVISNKRLFEAGEYPDIIQLDFYKENEVEAPQYARYFAVFDGKISEVSVFENGKEAAPYGTHLEPKSAGLMVQHLVADDGAGGYTVIKYEYTFDVENKRLNKKQVKFYGWEDQYD